MNMPIDYHIIDLPVICNKTISIKTISVQQSCKSAEQKRWKNLSQTIHLTLIEQDSIATMEVSRAHGFSMSQQTHSILSSRDFSTVLKLRLGVDFHNLLTTCCCTQRELANPQQPYHSSVLLQ